MERKAFFNSFCIANCILYNRGYFNEALISLNAFLQRKMLSSTVNQLGPKVLGDILLSVLKCDWFKGVSCKSTNKLFFWNLFVEWECIYSEKYISLLSLHGPFQLSFCFQKMCFIIAQLLLIVLSWLHQYFAVFINMLLWIIMIHICIVTTQFCQCVNKPCKHSEQQRKQQSQRQEG